MNGAQLTLYLSGIGMSALSTVCLAVASWKARKGAREVMVDTIARVWITEGGKRHEDFVRQSFISFTDAEIAAHCLAEWDLGIYGITAAELQSAFKRGRRQIIGLGL